MAIERISHSQRSIRASEAAPLAWPQAALLIGLLSAVSWTLVIGLGWALWTAL